MLGADFLALRVQVDVAEESGKREKTEFRQHERLLTRIPAIDRGWWR
jgi:hypothetical protein